jgi:hypothetical protein
MATSPAFAATPNVGSTPLSSSADSSYTAPSHAVTIFTPGASGGKVDEVRFVGTGTTVAGNINIFLYDGTTYHLIDQILVPAITPSTSTPAWTFVKPYANLVVPASWTLVATSIQASQLVNVSALGGSF